MESNISSVRQEPTLTLRQEQVRLTQRRILDTFESELLEQGYGGVSIRSVAKRAGISVPTIYRYYPNKGALMIALVDSSNEEGGFDPFAILASGNDPMDTITRLLDGIWGVFERRPGRVKALVQAVSSESDPDDPMGESFRRNAFFAREALSPLTKLPPEVLRELQATVALLIGPQAWFSLRAGYNLPLSVARSVVLDTIRAALQQAGASADKSPSGNHRVDRSEQALRERFSKATREI